MNKYRLWTLIIGIVLTFQAFLVVFLKSESNYFISGVGLGIGAGLIVFSEVMALLSTQYNQKGGKS